MIRILAFAAVAALAGCVDLQKCHKDQYGYLVCSSEGAQARQVYSAPIGPTREGPPRPAERLPD